MYKRQHLKLSEHKELFKGNVGMEEMHKEIAKFVVGSSAIKVGVEEFKKEQGIKA